MLYSAFGLHVYVETHQYFNKYRHVQPKLKILVSQAVFEDIKYTSSQLNKHGSLDVELGFKILYDSQM